MTAEAELLQSAVGEVARLLRADGAMIYLVDEADGRLHYAHDAGITNPEAQRLIRDLTLPIGVGMFGTAVASGQLTVTDDYPVDRRFEHSEVADRIVEAAAMRSMAVAPLMAEGRPIGAMGAYSSRPAAFSEQEIVLLRALADHAAAAIANQRLMSQLAASEEGLRAQAGELARRVEAQATLQTITARITAIRDPDEVLQQVVDAAKRLLGSDGGHLTLRDPAAPILRPHVIAGGVDDGTRAWLAIQEFPIGGGMNGLAARDGQPVWTRDYLVDPRIPHSEDDQQVANRMGLRGMAVAPLRAPGGEVFGTLAVSYTRPREIGSDEIALLQGLADVGAIAIANARLYEQLTESADELERLVGVQRTLGDIARRIAEVDDAAETLQQVVDASKTLLGSDGAHLTLMDDEGRNLIPMVVAGDTDPATRAWLRTQRFPVGGGINGLAAQTGEPAWTDDYRADSRIPHEPDDDSPERLQLGAAAVAPLRGIRGEVVGTLAITYRQPRAIDPRDVALLEELAGHGAVAARNAELYARLRDSERRYRFLVDHSPDQVFETDADGNLTYLSEASEPLTGWRPEELVGRPFAAVVAEPDRPALLSLFGEFRAEPDVERRSSFRLLHRDGREIPVETVALGRHEDGAFAGIHGSTRDISERARLEASLRQQAEELARSLEAQRSLSAIAAQLTSIRDPSVVLQRTVDEAHRLLGADLALVNPMSSSGDALELPVAHAPAGAILNDVVLAPGEGISGTAISEGRVVRTGDYLRDRSFRHTRAADGYIRRHKIRSAMSAPLIADGKAIGTLAVQARRPDAFSDEDAQLLGALAAQASVAITNARLLEQMQESERRYRHLVDRSPDLVWSVDADGVFTYLGESLERMTGFKPEELVGRHWRLLVARESLRAAARAWEAVQAHPTDDLQFRTTLPLAGGGSMAAEVNMVATLVDGRFAGAQGSIRDIRERERLEGELRRQAAALAAGEERANLARELHDSVTQALFSVGLTIRALELLMDRDPAAARTKLAELRELQKDALAEMRALIFELRPQALETDGLAQALRNHGAAVQGRTGLEVTVEVDFGERLPLDVEEALYRIAQEALHNVVKHANARHALISLRRVGPDLRLTIEDDGMGFDPREAPRGHLGLVGMQQRAERTGGELDISRRPGGGSSIRVTLPLARVTSDRVPVASAD